MKVLLLQELKSTKSTLNYELSQFYLNSLWTKYMVKKGVIHFVGNRFVKNHKVDRKYGVDHLVNSTVPRGVWRTTYGVLPMDTKACGGLG